MKRKIKKYILISLSSLMVSVFAANHLFAGQDPMPLISKNIPSFATGDNAKNANDASYATSWKGNLPGWVAFDLSQIPVKDRSKILFAWYNSDTYDYDPTILNKGFYGLPKSYTIEGNTAQGGKTEPKSGWEVIEKVDNNVYHSRQHIFGFAKYNWVRLNITAGNGSNPLYVSINVDIHSANKGAADSWIFYGDSITAGGMVMQNGNSFAQLINAANSAFYPAAECGGTGAILSTHGANMIETWLKFFPGKYVGLAFGTNDAWGNQTGDDKYYANLEKMVKEIIAAKKVPIVSKIPYSSLNDIANNLPAYNKKIDDLYIAYPDIIKGPDLETLFKNNLNYLSSDKVHPNENGYLAMRKAWAEAMLKTVYNK